VELEPEFYIPDHRNVYGPDFPGETFLVLKEKEEREYGEYRTRRLNPIYQLVCKMSKPIG
jgi:hypothetical protein